VEPGLIIGKGAPEDTQGWTENSAWARFTFHCLGAGTGVILLTSPMPGTIILRYGEVTVWTSPEPCEVTVHQFKTVGGVVVPVNKLAVLSPYLALIGLVGAVTVAVAIRRRKP